MNLIACRKAAPPARAGARYRLIIKTLLMVQYAAIFLLITCLHASATGNAQKISLAEKNAPLAVVLDKVTKQSNCSFFYNDQLLQKSRLVNVSVKAGKLEDVLELIFASQPLRYEVISEGMIVLREKKEDLPPPADTIVRGAITDENGVPVAGATVQVKNGKQLTATDNEGGFTLRVPNLNATLLVSSVGYVSQEVMLKKRSAIAVSLQEKVAGLNEIIVVGYGSVRKADLTGAVSRVKMDDLVKAPVPSFDQALAGRVAGVQVSGDDGQPGNMNNIVIRGGNSVNGDNSPLYVIDGFPLENADLNAISPADIESIDILKDASAIAIYGARGANGVIMITTKRGKKGAPKLSLNSYYGLQRIMGQQEMMNPYEFVKYQYELDSAMANATYFTGGKTVESYRNTPALNLQDDFFRTAGIMNHDVAVRGGSDKTRYSISANVMRQNGIIINSGFNRTQGRITLDQDINKNIKVGANVSYDNRLSHGSVIAQSNFSSSLSLLYGVWGYRPVSGNDINLDDQLFDPGFDPNIVADYRIHPVISARNQVLRKRTSNFLANTYAEFALRPYLKLRITGGYTQSSVEQETFNNSKTSSGSPRSQNGVNGSLYTTPTTSWVNENTLTYNKSFRKHTLNVLGGFTMQGSKIRSYGVSASQLSNESLGTYGLDESSNLSVRSTGTEWKMASFLGRVNYGYKSRYLFTASFRADGSSRFLEPNQWGYFPVGAIAWKMKEESFMKQIPVISEAKLRVSYGSTGNNRVNSDFPVYSALSFPINASYSYNNSAPSLGMALSSLGNPNLKWETTTSFDLGYDIGFFDQRVQLTVDYYNKTTKNLLLNASIPYTTGLGSANKNIGSMQNRGLEFTLNTVNVSNKKFTWNSSFNISFNRNKVLALTENQTQLFSFLAFDQTWDKQPPYVAELGKPVAQMWGLEWDGVYQYSDFDQKADGSYTLKPGVPDNGNTRSAIKPGDIKYKDLNGDTAVNGSDYTVIGRGLPVHIGGFTNNFTYKGFDLSVFFQWSYGNNLINANRLVFEGNGKGTPYLNQFTNVVDRWQPDNPSNTLFRAGGQGPAAYSSRVIEDGSYLRLKTVSMGYTFSRGLLKQLKLSDVRIYMSAQNLITWTKYTGPDPEVSVRNSILTPGFDYSAYPRPRTVTLGVNVTF